MITSVCMSMILLSMAPFIRNFAHMIPSVMPLLRN